MVAVFRLIGERWWATTAALYLPRVGFALPLPVLSLALLVDRSYRWLLTQLVALLLLLFPIMGLHLSGSHAATPGAPRLRLLTFNIDDGSLGVDALFAQVRAANPDVILFQEADYVSEEVLGAGLPGYSLRKTRQFVLASRFAIREVFEPPRFLHDGVLRTPRFMRYQVETPGGIIQLYSVHPVSPREALDDLRGAGLRQEITSGRILAPLSASTIDSARLRAEQVEAVAEDAGRSPYPVIIAGDTNLPELSWAYARALGGYRDGFADAASGSVTPSPRPGARGLASIGSWPGRPSASSTARCSGPACPTTWRWWRTSSSRPDRADSSRLENRCLRSRRRGIIGSDTAMRRMRETARDGLACVARPGVARARARGRLQAAAPRVDGARTPATSDDADRDDSMPARRGGGAAGGRERRAAERRAAALTGGAGGGAAGGLGGRCGRRERRAARGALRAGGTTGSGGVAGGGTTGGSGAGSSGTDGGVDVADAGSDGAIGRGCAAAGECASGFCVDGVCCNTPCAGACRTCAAAGSRGTCVAVAAGMVDPRTICVSDTVSSCGRNGLCDGAGGCQRYAVGTICSAPTCIADLLTPASTCDGTGTCTAPTSVSCAPYGCAGSGTRCSGGCPSGDAICLPGSFCAGDEQCFPKKQNGGPCAGNHECVSGACVSGVCCDSACAGPCTSCVLPSAVGTCTPAPAGTVCAPSSCAGTLFTSARRCDGGGSCNPGVLSNCAPYLCDAQLGQCRTGCATVDDCAPGQLCVSGACGRSGPPFGPCVSGAECNSGFCVQGYCCATACPGPCFTCPQPGALGICRPVANPDPAWGCGAAP